MEHLWSNWTIFRRICWFFFVWNFRYFCLCFIFGKRIRICTKGRWFYMLFFYLNIWIWSDCSIWISSAFLLCIDLVFLLSKRISSTEILWSALFENEWILKGPAIKKNRIFDKQTLPDQRKSAMWMFAIFSVLFFHSLEICN